MHASRSFGRFASFRMTLFNGSCSWYERNRPASESKALCDLAQPAKASDPGGMVLGAALPPGAA